MTAPPQSTPPRPAPVVGETRLDQIVAWLTADRPAADDADADARAAWGPVIAFDEPYTHKGSQKNLLGEDASDELIQSLSNAKQVSDETPPTFLFHTAEDTAVPPQNSLVYAMACASHSVPVELHLFPKGRHGIGLGKDIPGASQWPSLCAEWLMQLGMRDDE